ncbi:hypothetical protein SADUNF_Sadunf14G0069900 [Salix dunnii]|uniref:Uncharacterized protein n=1 Tax=Salix dunnii TaxID=1413687 RepID=A0A835JF48_9ROSI|nr:hypothetical protein SADUNF_Sadunf14G0069900 [Salix dunnii]
MKKRRAISNIQLYSLSLILIKLEKGLESYIPLTQFCQEIIKMIEYFLSWILYRLTNPSLTASPSLPQTQQPNSCILSSSHFTKLKTSPICLSYKNPSDHQNKTLVWVALLNITSNEEVRISPFGATVAANPTFISGLFACQAEKDLAFHVYGTNTYISFPNAIRSKKARGTSWPYPSQALAGTLLRILVAHEVSDTWIEKT